MRSKIAEALALKYPPVAILHTDEKPTDVLQFKEGRWGCVVALLMGAARGRPAAFDRKTFGCPGGGTGLGFGNRYVDFPGGIEYFLSTGNPEFCATEAGRAMVRSWWALAEGEGYFKTPELARKFINQLPMVDVPTKYVVFKPLDLVTPEETPVVVVFLANPDQISALTVLVYYFREPGEHVIVPFGAGCHSIGIIPYREAQRPVPRAVVGLVDISIRKRVDRDLLSFTVPYKMFLDMESNVEGSFLGKHAWREVRERYTTGPEKGKAHPTGEGRSTQG